MYLHPDNWTRGLLSLQEKLPGKMLHTISRTRLFQMVVFGVALCIAVFSMYHRFQPQTAAPCVTDFYSYYQSALRIGQGVAPYTGLANWIRDHATVPMTTGPYTDASCMSGAILEYSYTPFLGILLLPFTWLPYNAALLVWDACNLVFLGAAIYAFLRAARMPPTWLRLLVLTEIAMLLSPLRFDLYYAQIDVLLLFIACAGLWACVDGHTVLAGVLFAVACATEPVLLIIVGFLLWKREIKLAAVTMIGSVALILAPFLWLGRPALQDMLLIWRFYGGQKAVAFMNDAPRGILLRLFSSRPYVYPLTNVPGIATMLWLLISLIVLLIALSYIESRPLASDVRSLLDIGFAVTTALLISPWSENGQFTWLVVPCLAVYVCLRRIGIGTQAGRRLLIGFVGALVLLIIIGDDAQLALLAHTGANPIITAMLVLLAATYLYPLFAVAAVMLYTQRVDPTARGVTSGRFWKWHWWTQLMRGHKMGSSSSSDGTLSP